MAELPRGRSGPRVFSIKANFPFVKNWDVLIAGLNYPDVPSAEDYMPNINEAWTRLQNFSDLITNNFGLSLGAEESGLESDLHIIFNI
jgi:multiple sugar transport system substrate-binding protein